MDQLFLAEITPSDRQSLMALLAAATSAGRE